MNPQAREQLIQMISQYGPQVCNTPRTCEIFMRQFCSDYEEELEVLKQALNDGVVAQLMKQMGDQWDEVSLRITKDFVDKSGLSDNQAAWAVESWAMALGKHPHRQVSEAPIPKEPPKPEKENYDYSPDAPTGIKAPFIVTLAGAIGAAAGVFLSKGIITIVDVNVTLPEVEWLLGEDQSRSIAVVLGIILIVSLAAGAVCGGLGAFLGWMIGQGDADLAWPAAMAAVSATFVTAAVTSWLCGWIVVAIACFLSAASATLSAAFTGGSR